MNKSGNNIIHRIKKNIAEKKHFMPIKKRSLSSKNIIPRDNTLTRKYSFDNNDKEESVVASIIRTNTINNDFFKKPKENKINRKIKYYKENITTAKHINNDYDQIGDFSFINVSEKVKPFTFKPRKVQDTSHTLKNFNFLDIINNIRMIIIILVEDDTLHSSNDLLQIYQSIFLSLNSLGEINISYKNFLVLTFFRHFSYEETFKEIFPGLSFYKCKNLNLNINNFYCSYGNVLSVNDTPINSLFFFKESSTFVEIYKFCYCDILNDLISLLNIDSKNIDKTFLLVNWPNGKIYERSINKYNKSRILSDIFRICNNKNMFLIPDINYTPYIKGDYFGHLHKYNFDSDKVYVNLIWDMICGYPIDHRFFFVNMNYKLYSIIKDYYQKNIISIYANEYYHDYNLSIYLKRKISNISIKKLQQVKIEYNNLPSSLLDFFYDFNLKRGSEYANFYELISYFFSCKKMDCLKILKKIVLFFKLISFLIEFFWLGISLLISYAVFNETFGVDDNYNIDYFFSLVYAIIIFLLLFISNIFIKNKPRNKENKLYRNIKRNQDSYCILKILYIVHYLYDIFFFVCSIIAIIHLDKGKYKENENNYYIFNKKYFILLLILNILFAIIPSFIRPSNLISKDFLYYLVLQLVNSTCYFHIPYLFTCIRNINSSKKKFESIYITMYILFNGLLTILCLIFDQKTKIRMDFFYILSSILVILSGLKLLFIIIAICCQNQFNRKIATGQIPQYNMDNILESEYEKNIKEINFSIDTQNINNLSINKNDSFLPIKYIKEKPSINENNNSYFKKQKGLEKERTREFNIIKNNNNSLFLSQTFEADNKQNDIKSQKSINRRNSKFEKFGENGKEISIIKKDLNNEFDSINKSSILDIIERKSYNKYPQDTINVNENENEYNNNKINNNDNYNDSHNKSYSNNNNNNRYLDGDSKYYAYNNNVIIVNEANSSYQNDQ